MSTNHCKVIFFIFFIFILWPLQLFAGMDNIDFQKYRNFEKKWKLITVRYRKDTEEMRFIYANAIAYKNILNMDKEFSNGAVFGKIGIKTLPDTLFESSVIPNGARRYQFMVKNKSKYKKHHGWGYALFNEKGTIFNGEHPEDQINACSACHEIAKDRDFIFSTQMNLSGKHDEIKSNSPFKFENVTKSQIPIEIQSYIPNEFKNLKILKADNLKNIFQGTLEEIRPTLQKEAYQNKLPIIFLSNDLKRWSLVFPENTNDTTCLTDKKSGMLMVSIYTTIDPQQKINTLHSCFQP
jgi:hypothetical protein